MAQVSRECPYLDTVNRKTLNFDFEKVCSVTLETHNVYACLVCGKYFQGRGHGTPAETHSVQANHYVFMNLSDGKVYCLPDNYEVKDTSLNDIRYNLYPQFTNEEIRDLDKVVLKKSDIFGTNYLRGITPMNEIGRADYINAVMQLLSHVTPLRDFFLQEDNYKNSRSDVVQAFGKLVCKIWSSRKIKASVSAHEFLQTVAWASKNQFDIDCQADAADFLKWLMRELHIGLGGSHKSGSSIIHSCFQGEVLIETEILASAKDFSVMMEELSTFEKEKEKQEQGDTESNTQHRSATSSSSSSANKSSTITSQKVPALLLSLELPASPLFKEGREGKSLIPEIDIREALQKFNGKKFFDSVVNGSIHRRRYRITKLPPYIIMHMNRFIKTQFSVEKNSTIVDLCIHSLDMTPFKLSSVVDSKKEEVSRKRKRSKHGFPLTVPSLRPIASNKYNLVGNLCHHSADPSAFAETSGPTTTSSNAKKAERESIPVIHNASYSAHVYSKPESQWYEVQNLHVQATAPDIVGRSEAYLSLYENLSLSK
mmetsp:Transcript_6937/g.13852  ORF Transcript_6937/g.13852 Transcript_6937/m.13852 type:complete len:540 (+) Transcript_6937:190-1809(+)